MPPQPWRARRPGSGPWAMTCISRDRTVAVEKLLSVILEQSLTDLEHALPGSLQVLRLAAAIPPDTIPWPWLEELTEVFEPTPQFLKGRWTRIRRTLEGRDLITEGRHPGATGRMHRLIAHHLKNQELPEIGLVDAFITHTAQELGTDFTKTPELWEIESVIDALPNVLTRKPELLEQVPDFNQVALRYVTDTRIAIMLQNLTTHLAGTSTRTGFLAHSLLGDALRNTDPIQARESYQKSLAITRHLAEIWPEDLQARRDLTIALNNVAGMLKYSDPGQALGLYEESLDIGRELVTQLPGNLQVLWDLGVSAARLALLLPTKDPERVPLWREAAISLRDALAIQPEHRELGRMSYQAALDYADCHPDDRDEWLAYAVELAECFGFGKE